MKRWVVVVQKDVAAWARSHFGGLDLGDPRRSRRALKVGEMMARHPGKSLAGMSSSEYEMKAAYRLFGRQEVSPDRLQMVHRKQTAEQLNSAESTFLLLQDTTTVSFTGREPIAGLGPIGDGKPGSQGYFIHTVLGARWLGMDAEAGAQRRPAVEVSGLADQQFFVRTPRPAGEKKADKTKLHRRARESQIWGWATERCRRAPEGCDWVRVCDAEGDIHPFMVECLEYNHSFVIRASRDRVLVDNEVRLSMQAARGVSSLGEFSLKLRARPGTPARTARLSLGSCSLKIRAPYRPGVGRADVLECHVVRVWEENPPPGVKALEWVLLSDRPAASFEQALEIAIMYSCRWLIEEYHKVLKSGMGIERLQLEEGQALMRAGAMMSVVALRLLALKENVRCAPDLPAEQSGLTPLELKTLSAKRGRELHTIGDVALAIGWLGGHKGRKCDAMPGWKTLWEGWLILAQLVEGVKLARSVLEI